MSDQPAASPHPSPAVSHRGLVFATLVLCAAFGEVATGLLAPAMPTLGRVYERAPSTVQLTILAFAVMFAVGQLLFGPLSDRSGRRRALLIGAVLTLAGSLGASLANGIEGIIVGRAVQGFGAAAGYVIARAMVRDIYGAKGAASAMALMFALMAASFLAAPLAGGVLLDVAGWRGGFLLAAVAAGIWLLSTVFILPETRPTTLAASARPIPLVYLGLFRDRGFRSYMATHSIAYGGLYCFIAGAPYLFIQAYARTPANYGAIAATVMSGFLIGSLVSRYANPRWGMRRVIMSSLVIMLGASVSAAILERAGFLTGSVIIGIELAYFIGAGLLAPNTAAGVMMSHPQAVGAAAAALGFVQMCVAGSVALIQGVIYDGTPFPMVGTQAALSLMALIAWRRLSCTDR